MPDKTKAARWSERTRRRNSAIRDQLNYGLVLGICFPLAGFAAPRISFEKTFYDFGRTTGVESVTAKFALKNVGDDTLKLGKLTTSCGCTEATATVEKLEPGETGEIQFKVKMTSARATIRNHIYVPSNDPTNSVTDLMVKVDYVPLFEVEPLLVRLDMRLGETTNASVKIRRTDGRPLGALVLEPSKPWLKAELEPGTKPEATEARMLVEAKPEGASRYYTELVRLIPAGQQQPAATAVIMGRIVSDVNVKPEILVWDFNEASSLSAAQRDSVLTRRLIISSAGPPLVIRNPKSTLPELKVELLPEQDRDGYHLVASLEKAPKGNLRGTINFETNLPKLPNVQVPVVISVAAK